MRFILTFVFMLLGTLGNAQSVEERLNLCIEESQHIITLSKAWRRSLEEMGETPTAGQFARILTALETASAVNEMFSLLPDESLKGTDLKATYYSFLEPTVIRNNLIEGMVIEAFEEPTKYEALAEYIAQCSRNFGGETYNLRDEVFRLQSLISDFEEKFQSLEIELQESKQLIRSRNQSLENRNRELQILTEERAILDKKLETLCIWMKTYRHLDVLDKKVSVDGESYYLCK